MSLTRVVVVDDHPAMRAGVRAVLERVDDLEVVGEAADHYELWPILYSTKPDVVLLDFHLRDENGLRLSYRIKRGPLAPAVVVYSAYADAWLESAGCLAQADAVLPKEAEARVLVGTLRSVALDGWAPPALAAEPRERLMAALAPEDVGLAGLLLLRVPRAELMQTTGLEPDALDARVDDLLDRVIAASAPVV